METLDKLIDRYKESIQIQSDKAWDMIKAFKEALCKNAEVDKNVFWNIMKDFHESVIGKHFNESYAIYQVSQMFHTDSNRNRIETPMFSIEHTKEIFSKYIRKLNKTITVWDLYVALNAEYHDHINLYKRWFPDATTEELENKIIESAIDFWFNDEDVSDNKIWKYFRAF